MQPEGHAPLRIGIIGSGKGSNCLAILNAIDAHTLNASVACIMSDHEGAGILDHGKKAGIPSFYVSPAPFKTKLDGVAELAYIDILKEHGVELIVLAGFMRIIKDGMLNAFPNKVVNIHPSLLPRFPGLAAWEQALDSGDKTTGCTVHFVDSGIDTGPLILQKEVPILPDDTIESLHARIQIAEHTAYPEALQRIASGQVSDPSR